MAVASKKKEKKPEVDPARLKEYEKVIDKINRIYIDRFFKTPSSSENVEDSTTNLVDEELLKLTHHNGADNDFELLSTIRYDPSLSTPKNFNIDSVFHAQLLGIHDEDASRNDNTAIATVTDTSSHFDSFCLFNNDGFNESNDYNSSSFFLFDEHYHRLNFELKYFDFPYQIDRPELLKNLNSALEGLDKSQPYKLRVTVNRSGDVKITAHHILNRSDLFDGLTINSIDEYISSGSTLWSVHIDKKPILISPFTSFKTTRRDHYSEARGRSLPAVIPEGEQHEVLLFNSANHVMEGSITNIAIRQFDEEKQEFDWVTPVLASGCLCGVVRHMLLSKGLIKEKLILLKDVKVGDEVLLMNGIIGVVKGRIVD